MNFRKPKVLSSAKLSSWSSKLRQFALTAANRILSVNWLILAKTYKDNYFWARSWDSAWNFCICPNQSIFLTKPSILACESTCNIQIPIIRLFLFIRKLFQQFYRSWTEFVPFAETNWRQLCSQNGWINSKPSQFNPTEIALVK